MTAHMPYWKIPNRMTSILMQKIAPATLMAGFFLFRTRVIVSKLMAVACWLIQR